VSRAEVKSFSWRCSRLTSDKLTTEPGIIMSGWDFLEVTNQTIDFKIRSKLIIHIIKGFSFSLLDVWCIYQLKLNKASLSVSQLCHFASSHSETCQSSGILICRRNSEVEEQTLYYPRRYRILFSVHDHLEGMI
jgi:hypothetical protein